MFYFYNIIKDFYQFKKLKKWLNKKDILNMSEH